MRDMIYDIETYKNLFSITFKDVNTGKIKVFEMSPWQNDWDEFKRFARNCSNEFVRWIGFNNYAFDYPVIHFMMQNFKQGKTDGAKLAQFAHDRGTKLIRASHEDKFNMIIWDNNHIVPQVDLFKIHHFDNKARMTSLKVLEFNMRSKTIQDLPYDPEKPLTYEQSRELLDYNIHDVEETYKFYLETLDMIKFREELTEKYGKNFINFNDTKIGKEYFIMELEKANISCYTFGDDGRKPVQTKRPFIRLNDVIFPYVKFKRPEFNGVLAWIRKQKITETKGVFNDIEDFEEIIDYVDIENVKYGKINHNNGKVTNRKLRTFKFEDNNLSIREKIEIVRAHPDTKNVFVTHLHCVVDGFQFDFGTGGIHGSVPSTIVEEDEYNALLDYDVTSLYPSIAIVNEIYPKHLTRKFCEIYGQMKEDRVSYEKGTPENAMLKLALNGVYGDSNNKFSPFYDPQYTMAITINGQLMLCMLAEAYMRLDTVEMVQINTDGITLKVNRDKVDVIERINEMWEKKTKLDLERADYSKMFIRDVNNYIGVYTDGKLKRKGAYEYDIGWHQNHSSLVIQKAVEAHLVDGVPVREFMDNHDDFFDFLLRTKVPRSSKLMCGDKQVQNITRYYISKSGGQLTKVMPPLKAKPDVWRNIKIHDGYNATEINTVEDGYLYDFNTDYYMTEANKLITPLYEGMLRDMVT